MNGLEKQELFTAGRQKRRKEKKINLSFPNPFILIPKINLIRGCLFQANGIGCLWKAHVHIFKFRKYGINADLHNKRIIYKARFWVSLCHSRPSLITFCRQWTNNHLHLNWRIRNGKRPTKYAIHYHKAQERISKEACLYQEIKIKLYRHQKVNLLPWISCYYQIGLDIKWGDINQIISLDFNPDLFTNSYSFILSIPLQSPLLMQHLKV